jgi:predicted Rossmann fold flavoprotein
MPRVVVVGAGAAGTMAAIFAASNGADTVLLERTKDGGRKILISGGGRCNVLPTHVDESRFVSESSPAVLRRILRSWPLREQIRFFQNRLQLPLIEEAQSSKYFPVSQRARDVRDRLMAYARNSGVSIMTDTMVTTVRRSGRTWFVERGGPAIEADAVILATGGLSVPTTGSDGLGLQMANALGHTIHTPYPALTPLVAETGVASPLARLAGISLPVTVRARSERHNAESTGGFLFTHRGYSGPAVLDISHVAVRSRLEPGPSPALITVQWASLTEQDWNEAFRPHGTATVLSAIDARLPRRLAESLLAVAGVDASQPLAQLTRARRQRLTSILVRTELPWSGDDGYRKAEVTGGGISLDELDPITLESRRQPGLFLCGEMLDAFGPIGGYNFFWAWATGRAAGIGASRLDKRKVTDT